MLLVSISEDRPNAAAVPANIHAWNCMPA